VNTTNDTGESPSETVDKKTQAEINLARKRLLAFTRGASDMAATATEVLEAINSGHIPKADENETDIFRATRGFRQRCVTKKEIDWYESIKTVKSITLNAERRALAEESRPWRLLNLPEVSVETQARYDIVPFLNRMMYSIKL
jgi:hypothetical protein